MIITFTVPSVPVPQPRQRHRVMRIGGKAIAQNYTPSSHPVNAFKAAVQLASSKAYSGPPLDGPLLASYVFVLPRGGKPAWLKKKEHPEWFAAWKRGERVPHITKPDRDNLTKPLQDAMNGTVIKDDSRICSGPSEKWVASESEQPHVQVTLLPLEKN